MEGKSGKFKRTTVTAALPYANGPIHIGHLAGVYVPADIYVRFLREVGEEVIFICGSDEHGVPITLKAKNEGISPQEVVDRYHAQIQDSFEAFGISFDEYSRTSNPTHHQTASEFFSKLEEKGVFKVQESEQYFDEQEQQFLADRYIKGTCPNCAFEDAYGDQCERCGTSLSPSDLKDPRSVLSGNAPVKRKTKHWYLPLDQYETWLKTWLLEGHQEWKPNVYGQCKSWIDQGLQPRAVTRDLDWGVPVPLEEGKGKVLYVWFDAPIGYISATKEWAGKKGVNWETYWKDPETRLIHFIGKDNIVFHCIIFPTMLEAEGSYILPDNVPANEFLNLEGNKLSTSRNWAVWLHEYLEDFPGMEDVLRYVLTANAPESKDNDFTWKDFQAKNNNELVAILGNFVNRALVLTQKYFDGKVPDPGALNADDQALLEAVGSLPTRIEKQLRNFKFREALSTYMELARLGNKYLAEQEPWKKFSEDPARVGTVLNLSIQLVGYLGQLGNPFLPRTSRKISAMLGGMELKWPDGINTDLIPAGTALPKPELLFSKIEDAEIGKQVEKLGANKKEEEASKKPMEEKVALDFSDFQKMDLRIAEITSAEQVENTDKLLKLELDLGNERRTVVSGIATSYKPDEVVGKRVLYLSNLAPKKIRGIESQGMVLMAENEEGNLSFLVPERNMGKGADVR